MATIESLVLTRETLAWKYYSINMSISISTSTCVSKWEHRRHKHKHKHKKNGRVRSSCAYAYAYAIALTSEYGVDISTSISTRYRLRLPSCLSSGWGKLVSRIESNMPFCACVICPYAYDCNYAFAYAHALMKTQALCFINLLSLPSFPMIKLHVKPP